MLDLLLWMDDCCSLQPVTCACQTFNAQQSTIIKASPETPLNYWGWGCQSWCLGDLISVEWQTSSIYSLLLSWTPLISGQLVGLITADFLMLYHLSDSPYTLSSKHSLCHMAHYLSFIDMLYEYWSKTSTNVCIWEPSKVIWLDVKSMIPGMVMSLFFFGEIHVSLQIYQENITVSYQYTYEELLINMSDTIGIILPLTSATICIWWLNLSNQLTQSPFCTLCNAFHPQMSCPQPVSTTPSNMPQKPNWHHLFHDPPICLPGTATIFIWLNGQALMCSMSPTAWLMKPHLRSTRTPSMTECTFPHHTGIIQHCHWPDPCHIILFTKWTRMFMYTSSVSYLGWSQASHWAVCDSVFVVHVFVPLLSVHFLFCFITVVWALASCTNKYNVLWESYLVQLYRPTSTHCHSQNLPTATTNQYRWWVQ